MAENNNNTDDTNTNDKKSNQEVQSCPSYNPADLTTTAGMLDYIYRCNSMATENCIPAIVESYDRNKNVVTVKPSINITAATGETIERESITATVMSICGGKFIINFPLEKGDTGWLITADRDISLFREQRKVINANTNRIHSIEDSFFIPDRVNDFKINEEDKDNFILQSLSRNLRISLSKEAIKIYSGPPIKDEKKSKEKSGEKDEKKSPETSKDKEQENEKTQETFITLTSDKIDILSGYKKQSSGNSSSKEQKDQKTQETSISMTSDKINIISGHSKDSGEKSSSSQQKQETTITLTNDKIDIHSGHSKNSDNQSKQETDISLTVDTIKIYSTAGQSNGNSGSSGEKQESAITMNQDKISIVTTEKLEAESKNAKITVKEKLEAESKEATVTIAETLIGKAKNANITIEENLTAKCKNGDVKADSNINISASNVHIKGQVSIEGPLSVSGSANINGSTSIGSSLSVSGSVNASGDVTGAGKSLSGHIHQGVHGPTGGPM